MVLKNTGLGVESTVCGSESGPTPPEAVPGSRSPEPPLAQLRSPRMRRASCMSRGMMVTRLAWIAHRLVSSNRPTRYASAASWRARTAEDCGAARSHTFASVNQRCWQHWRRNSDETSGFSFQCASQRAANNQRQLRRVQNPSNEPGAGCRRSDSAPCPCFKASRAGQPWRQPPGASVRPAAFSHLEAKVGLELLGDLADEALEGELADEQLRRLLEATDLAERHGAGAIPVGLLHAAGRGRALASGLGGEVLAGRLAASGLAGSLLSAGHAWIANGMRVRLPAVFCSHPARP